MVVDDRECNNCGASNWTKVLETDYPERRRDRDRTVKTLYACDECNEEGKHFEHQHMGTEKYTGALR